MNKCCFLYAKERISTYSACFIGKTVDELVEDFNQFVGHLGWTQERAYYNEALLIAFQERGIDVSVISDGQTISFAHLIRFDVEQRALVLAKEEGGDF